MVVHSEKRTILRSSSAISWSSRPSSSSSLLEYPGGSLSTRKVLLAAMRQMSSIFCRRSRSISVRNPFRKDRATILLWAAWIASCSSVGGMRRISVVRGGRSLHDRFPGPAQQDGPQPPAQFVEILVAEHLARFVHHPVAVEEAEGGPQPPFVDELHDRVELVQAVFQRRAREHQGERRAQPLDDPAGLGFPVLDALAFVEDDQVPA